MSLPKQPDSGTQIVPFGKYSGQPVEVMLADEGYLEWVTSQPGLMRMLERKHPVIFNIITVGAPATDDTPEHNQLAARFLDRDFHYAFIENALGQSVEQLSAKLALKVNQAAKAAFDNCKENAKQCGSELLEELPKAKEELQAAIEEHNKKDPQREYQKYLEPRRSDTWSSKPMSYQDWYQSNDYEGFNYRVHHKEKEVEKLEHKIKKVMDFITQLTEPKRVSGPVPEIETVFECGYDVDLKIRWTAKTESFWQCEDQNAVKVASGAHTFGSTTNFLKAISTVAGERFRIELKPNLGDDFPGVLRQMKRNESDTLVIGSFEAKGATLAQVRTMFGKIRILTLAEIDAVQNNLWPT
jgi:hypothetical protein